MRTCPFLMIGLLVIAAFPALAIDEEATLDEIAECVEANLPGSTSVQTVTFHATDRGRHVRTARATMYYSKQPDGLGKMLIRFNRPYDLRGAGYLLIERERDDDMFVYLPNVGVRRITGRMVNGSMFGTDLASGQVRRL